MDTLKKIFKKKKSPTGESPEAENEVPVLEVSETFRKKMKREIEPIHVKSIKLTGSERVERILDEIQDGNIVISNMTPLMEEGPEELKEALNHLKESAEEMGGQVAKLSDSRIIAAPELVKIQL